MIDIDKLEKLAQEATPGPWSFDDGNVFSQPLNKERRDAIMARIGTDDALNSDAPPQVYAEGGVYGFVATCTQTTPRYDEDSQFIAAANPATVLELIQRLRECNALIGGDHEMARFFVQKGKEGGLESGITGVGPLFTWIAAEARTLLDANELAVNFLEIKFADDRGELALCVQRCEGETPGAKATRLGRELDAANQQLAELTRRLEEAEKWVPKPSADGDSTVVD